VGIVKQHLVRRTGTRPAPAAGWDDPTWSAAEPIAIDSFRPEGSDHRPRTQARLLHTGDALCGIFRVEDRYVRCRHVRFQDPVYEDSCVEIFVQPKPDGGYLNFEMNCGGALLSTHISDHRRVPGGFAAFSRLTAEEGRLVGVRPSLAPPIEPERVGPLDWTLSFVIPVALLEGRVGAIGPLSGQEWRANLFKCGDETSHPHWASWSAVDELNFHLPRCFGLLRFE
jgi:hypothetical protein